MNMIENSPDNSFLQSSFWIQDKKVKDQVLKTYQSIDHELGTELIAKKKKVG